MQQGEAIAGPTVTRTYVYCVIPTDSVPEESTAFGPSIDGSPPVRALRENGLTALVSDALRPDYDPSRANIGAHERIVREAYERGDVLPMRFGTVAQDDRSVESFLREKHKDLERALEELHGRAELAVKASWVDQDTTLRAILEEDDAIRQLREEIMALPEGEAHEQRVELGRRVSEAMEQRRKADADRILERLRPRALDVQVQRLLSETMVVNASFLVDRAEITAFDEAVNELGAEESGTLTLKYVGPLPPYSFVKITVPKEGT